MKLFLFIISFLFTSSVFANNPGVSYQGRIFKPDGYPLEGANVQFRMQVRSPGAENCLLFEEIQTVNMTGSSGIFSITLNDGTGTRLDTPTYQVDRIFANRDVMTLDATRCAAGTTYTPNTADGRKFVVYFKDETMAAYEPLPIMNLNYAPQAMYALEAQKVGTFAVNNILRAVDVSGNPVTAPALNPTQLTNLNNLLAGTSSQYASATDFSTVQTFAKAALPTCGAGEVLKANGTAFSCVVDSAGGSPAYSAITAATATNTIDNTSYAQTWNWSTATTQSPMSLSANALTTGSGLNLTTSSAALNSTNGFLNVANTGASTSGILARMQSNSTAGSGLTVLTNGNVGIGTASPSYALSVVSDTIGVGGGLIKLSSSNIVSMGINNSVGYNNSTGIGRSNNTASADGAIAIGNSNTAANDLALAIGRNNTSYGAAVAVGSGNVASSNSVALGININNTILNSLQLGPSDASKMTILSTGNVGIKTTTPANELSVAGSANISGSLAIGTSLVPVYGLEVKRDTIYFANSAGLIPYFYANGTNVTLGGSSSAGSKVGIQGNASIGTSYAGIAAPVNGLIVEGNIGIKTMAPTEALEVGGNIKLSGFILNQEDWITPAFLNSWIDYGGGVYAPVGYFKDKNGIVHLRGLMKSGTCGAAAFNLPAGYRPEYRLIISTITNTAIGVGRLDIFDTGDITPDVTLCNNSYFSLDGVSFRAEQ